MATIIEFDGHTPKIGDNCFIADNATIIGQVSIGNNCSIWFGSVVRGDVGEIAIGDNVNIQDNAVIHCSELKSTVSIGNNVTIGHNAIVHGATIKDNVLIGMGSTVLDNTIINVNTIIGANALVPGNLVLEPNSIYAGIPAKKIKGIPDSSTFVADSAIHYVELKNKYLKK